MRWFMTLAYRGAPFHGWQVQPGEETVQGRLESALSTLVRRPVAVTGAGRTDTGVNAAFMVAHVDLPDELDPREPRFLKALNSIAGRDIAVKEFVAVAADAHARFDATERAYRYFVHTFKNPFDPAGLSWQAPPALDFEGMNRAASLLLGRRDFTSFAKLHTDAKTNICDLRSAVWTEYEPGRWYFEIRADRFLRNMVRAIVGTLLEVGRGKLTVDGFRQVIEAKDRGRAGTSAPGYALYLVDVTYPEELFQLAVGC